jgi:hypothetical protein
VSDQPPPWETPEQQRLKLLAQFYGNRRLAHEVIFKHRHPIKTPSFHHEIQDAFHGDHPQVVIEGFRDAAKSTVAEEAFVLKALFEEFKFGIVLGASVPRARERLAAIANEFITNDSINQLFGRMEGSVWGAGKIVLANGVCIIAAGAGQSMRGMRYLDSRPDFALVDDLEDEESVRTPEMRAQMMSWLYRTFIPALKKGAAGRVEYQIRFMGNRLDNDAVIVQIAKDPAWKHMRFPVMHQADDGVERFDLPPGKWAPLWGEKFSLSDIAAKRQEYVRLGLLHAFDCEYMCEADNPEAHLFKAGDAKTVARVRTWQATYAAYDPARTAKSTSATTGVAVFSWIGTRLVVWRGSAHLWLPDEIVNDILKVNSEFTPVHVGVEATGLEQFILQPLRHEALRRRQLLPIMPLIPPQGKDTFIRGLQPFFKSGEVEFADVSDEAKAQLMAFPRGRKDFPNALAYALRMRPGLPVYEISSDHVQERTIRLPSAPFYLIANASAQFTAAALTQLVDGQVRVHADFMREGPPGENLSEIVREARLDAGGVVRLVIPPAPAGHDTIGLRVAVRALQRDPRTGGPVERGRAALGDLLQRRRREQPLFVCNHAARWVLNALTGGYAYSVGKRGELAREPADGYYRVLMEGVESFCAHLDSANREEDPVRTAVGADGQPYRTILPAAAAPSPAKDEWASSGMVNSPRTIRVTNG